MHLFIKTDNDSLKLQYENHSTYHEGDSGLDLFCPETITIQPGETEKINLQIQCEAFQSRGAKAENMAAWLRDSELDRTVDGVAAPRISNKQIHKNMSYYLYPRSSIVKTPLRLSNSVGIIDAGYRGDIIACVDNIKTEPFTVEAGTRLFQICAPDLSELKFDLVDDLSDTTRGAGGFGSTNASGSTPITGFRALQPFPNIQPEPDASQTLREPEPEPENES